MLIYYRRSVIAAFALALAVPLVTFALYTVIAGQLMTATWQGICLLVVLLALSSLFAFRFMEAKAERETERILAIYNVRCDPYGFIDASRALVEIMRAPYGEASAWFMGYYAQALLDAGDIDAAKTVEGNLIASMDSAKNGDLKCAILVNLVPLTEKMEGAESALELIRAGIDLARSSGSSRMAVRLDYLVAQRKILADKASGHYEELAARADKVKDQSTVVMRIRVEMAYEAAMAYFFLHLPAREREDLDFVIENGNKLALVDRARSRLTKI